MAMACTGTISRSGSPASCRLHGLLFQRMNAGGGFSPELFFCRRSTFVSLRQSFVSFRGGKSRSTLCCMREQSGVSSSAGEQRVVNDRSLDLEHGGGSAVESVRDDSPNPAKIWMRKQTAERALSISSGTRAAREQGTAAHLSENGEFHGNGAEVKRWFPPVHSFQTTDGTEVATREIIELLGPCLSEERKRRIDRVVHNRTFSVCTVVEGLSDVGNVSAICRSADAMGFQSVHVVSNSNTLRYRENQRTSAGAEKWLDVETWGDTQSCLKTLKSRGYQIAVTHIADDTVSVHDMDWTVPTAVVLGNEHRGISEEAIRLSDVRCSIPMAGMVESFNVSVAAAIIMHHAVMDRISRAGAHGDLSESERDILRAEFFMRHKNDTREILDGLVKRRLQTSGLQLQAYVF